MQSIAQIGLAEQTINKSRFVAVAACCANESEVNAFLKSLAANDESHQVHFIFPQAMRNSSSFT